MTHHRYTDPAVTTNHEGRLVRSRSFNAWFGKAVLIVAMMMIFGMPAIYYACTQWLGLDLKKSVGGAFQRIFAGQDGSSESGDSGGD